MGVPPPPSVHAGATSTFTSALTTADPQPACSDTTQLKDAEAKLSQTCAELAITKSQLQVLDWLQYAAVLVHVLHHLAPSAARSYASFSRSEAAPVPVLISFVQQLLHSSMHVNTYLSPSHTIAF